MVAARGGKQAAQTEGVALRFGERGALVEERVVQQIDTAREVVRARARAGGTLAHLVKAPIWRPVREPSAIVTNSVRSVKLAPRPYFTNTIFLETVRFPAASV